MFVSYIYIYFSIHKGIFTMGKSRILSEIANFQALMTKGFLPSSQVPAVFREPGILNGYRPCGKDWGYYFFSILRLHNETGNIWTHGMASFIMLYKTVVLAGEYSRTGDDIYWLLSVFGICGLLNTLLSSFAHTFHSKSVLIHYLCYQGDYAGIGILGLGNSLLFFHASTSDRLYVFLKDFSLPVYVILVWVFMAGACMVKLRYKRPYPIRRKVIQLICGLVQSLMGGLPVLSKYVTCLFHTECSLTSLNHHSICLLTLAGSMFFFSSHLPEKKYPGYFDCVGQGHQIFHVLISITMLLEFDAAMVDAKIGQVRPIDKTGVLLALMVSIIGCGVVMVCLLKFTRKRVEADMKDK